MALAQANATLVLSGRTPIYCPNDGMNLRGSDLWKLATERLEGNWKPADLMAGIVVEVQAAYPCK